MNYDTTPLTPEQEQFLESYCPKDDWCTTTDEMEAVETALFGENVKTDLLQPMRNAVVLFYSNLKKVEIERNGQSERFWSLMTAMMSVTAVIDNLKFQAGLPV